MFALFVDRHKVSLCVGATASFPAEVAGVHSANLQPPGLSCEVSRGSSTDTVYVEKGWREEP
jgi:hypothetical protein